MNPKRENGQLNSSVCRCCKLTLRGFKALKQMTKMNYLHLGRPDEALTTYRELLGYTKVSCALR